MKRIKAHSVCLVGALVLALAVLIVPDASSSFAAQPQASLPTLPVGECDVSTAAYCPATGAVTTGQSCCVGNNCSFCKGARSEAQQNALVAIDAPALINGQTVNRCRYVDNNQTSSDNIFVPFYKPQEWGAFITAATPIAGTDPLSTLVQLVPCSVPAPGTIQGGTPSPGLTVSASATCTNATPKGSQPVNAETNYYPFVAASPPTWTAQPAYFTCNDGAGTFWTEQAIATFVGEDADTHIPSWAPQSTAYDETLAPTVTLTANPMIIAPGAATTLTWAVKNASSCTASNNAAAETDWNGNASINGGTKSVKPRGTPSTTFYLSCLNAASNLTTTANVTINEVPLPTVSLTADPVILASGSATTLSWVVANATSCTASNDGPGENDFSGNVNLAGLTSTLVQPMLAPATTYSIVCVNSYGMSASSSVTINLVLSPTVSLVAHPTTIGKGGATTLTWAITNATACTASNDGPDESDFGGSIDLSGPTSTLVHPTGMPATTYTINCTDGYSTSASSSVTIEVVAAPTVTLAAVPTSVTSGGTTTLTWTVDNAVSCTASNDGSGENDWTGDVASSGTNTASVKPLTLPSTTYTIECVNSLGATASASVTVVVTPAPIDGLCPSGYAASYTGYVVGSGCLITDTHGCPAMNVCANGEVVNVTPPYGTVGVGSGALWGCQGSNGGKTQICAAGAICFYSNHSGCH